MAIKGYIQKDKRLISTLAGFFLVFLLFFSIASRDLITLFFSKQNAYFLQVAIILISLLMFKNFFNMQLDRQKFPLSLLIVLFFMLLILISTLITVLESNTYPYIYVLTNMFIAFLFLFFTIFKLKSHNNSVYFYAILCSGSISFIFAILQQLGVPIFTEGILINYENDQLRPSALTGSSLHYPLYIVLVGAVLSQFGILHKNKIIFFFGLVFITAPFLAFSRSGILIVFVSAFFLFFSGSFSLIARLRFVLVVVFLFIPIIFNESIRNRIVSIVNLEDAGNLERLVAWERGYSLFLDSPILFGNKVGLVTNTTRNLSESESEIVESSVLQQLVNFGLLGTIVFYAMFFFAFTSINKRLPILRSFFVGAVFQTLFFQSIEVLPFIVLLLSFPLFSSLMISVKENLKHT